MNHCAVMNDTLSTPAVSRRKTSGYCHTVGVFLDVCYVRELVSLFTIKWGTDQARLIDCMVFDTVFNVI